MKSLRNKSGKTCADQLLHGNCLQILKSLNAESIDLVCTDPPYGIGIFGSAWDAFKRTSAEASFQTFMRSVAADCLRVLKPGAFMFFTMTPRQDSLVQALQGVQDAGFVTSFSSLYWTYAKGFPKAMNVGKLLKQRSKQKPTRDMKHAAKLAGAYAGFQPKPVVEVVVVAMKPLAEGTYSDQALLNGKGVTWLDDCRIPSDEPITIRHGRNGAFAGGHPTSSRDETYRKSTRPRFPANLLVSDSALGEYSRFFSLDKWDRKILPFLPAPKPSNRERNYSLSDGEGVKNTHPTVKPLSLMAYLITLGSRPGDVVLDPFLGSGTTALAAKLLGRRYIGIEREKKYLSIARARLATS
ncbi:MAG TPA: site-specific DNA-methyltransferase [Rhizomicrobium sp.]|nr:site-specific DNA-methyltransferase [Rhizomicrobium sp.]